MTEAFKSERPEAIEEYTVEERKITSDGAAALIEAGLEALRGMELSAGFLAVYDHSGMELATRAYGGATKVNVDIAKAKIKTVLAVRRSTSLQAARMVDKGQSREDFAGQLGSLFGGGIPLLSDYKEFLGAMAFSGGTPEQDQEVCRRAVESVGLFTDVPSPEVPQS